MDDRSLDAQTLRGIIDEVLHSLDGDIDFSRLKVLHDLEEIAQTISRLRTDISAIDPGAITQHHLPKAADELDAVVNATERATGTILDAVERVETLAGTVEAPAAEILVDAVTRIYEACNFQDITGQRITKVVHAMKEIELRVSRLIDVLGIPGAGVSGGAVKTLAAQPDRGFEDAGRPLAEGPQLPTKAMSQDEIDALLAF